MKALPLSWSELAFISLVIVLPLVVGFSWPSDTTLGLLLKTGAFIALGFCLWFVLVFASAYHHNQNRKKR